jgi:hypothetical protein
MADTDNLNDTIEVTAGADRPTPQEQIAAVLRALSAGDPVRVRVPFMLLDPESKNYFQLRETYWRMVLPNATQEQLEAIIEAIGACMMQIGTYGADAVKAKVGELG